MTSEKKSAKSYYNGQWRAVWRVGEHSCTGELAVITHLYEQGNVQARFTSKTSFECQDGFVEKIKQFEQRALESIDQAFADLSGGTFKKLRRQLPVTRSKLDWYGPPLLVCRAKIASYKVGDELSKSHRAQ